MSPGRIYTVEGIVLKRRNSGEVDRIITLFTKEKGKLVVTAKGIRRITSKRAPHLEIFSRGRLLVYRGQRHDTLSEVAPIDTYPDLRKQLIKISAAYYLCEVVDALLPQQLEHRDVYTHLVGALSFLDSSNLTEGFLSEFTEKLLVMLGFLSALRPLPGDGAMSYVEQLTERKLRTRKLLRQLA